MKRIKNRCASYRQHTLPHIGEMDHAQRIVGRLREASRQNPAPEAKLTVVRIPYAMANPCANKRFREANKHPIGCKHIPRLNFLGPLFVR
nr:hypothetical protein [Methylomarinum sp. Ch1-1]MDP4521299.1 hypothetical protein [Methylomarinum sp. Ch1-1]